MKKTAIIHITVGIFFVLCCTAAAYSQGLIKRCRDDGLYLCESANTAGSGNVWIALRSVGFLWDSDPAKNNRPEPFAFPEGTLEINLHKRLALVAQSRFLTYGWHYDYAGIGLKYVCRDNTDIRFLVPGFFIGYKHRFLNQFHTSIAGYQDSKGTGFTPEGFIAKGGSVSLLALMDIDFIAKNSRLPIKLYSNAGVRIITGHEYVDCSQYLCSFGIAYAGLASDLFCEYSLEAFLNNPLEPKRFSYAWQGFISSVKTWEVAFLENPMYLAFGGRIRYANGSSILLAVPILLSTNVGSSMTQSDKNSFKSKFPDEAARGITDPFDPWYPKWKVVLQYSYPLRYRRTGAEMSRIFLLLKNKKDSGSMEFDHEMNKPDTMVVNSTIDSDDRKKRLEEIKKRLEEIEKK